MAIFISYSRRDDGFVRQLHERILARGRETWVDWEGIPPSADWMREIREAIDAAEAMVFVISPDSLASGVCAQELEHAVAQNKRLIPVVCRDVEAATAATSIGRLNWVFFTTGDFDRAFETLIEAVDTDLEWVQAHTRLLVRSAEWERRGRDPSLTLRGTDLKSAERWLTESPNKSPHATEVQTRYILESRRRATQRRYAAWGGVAVALAITAALGTLFVLQRNETARQQASAFARRLAGTAERVRATPGEFSTDTDRNILSAQLAVEAVRRVDALGLRSVDADIALRQAVALLPPRVAQLEATHALDVVAFGTAGEIVAAGRLKTATYVWNPDFSLATEQASSVDARSVVLSPDGRVLAAIEPEGRRGSVELRDTRTNAVMATLSLIQSIDDVAVAPEGRYAVVSGGDAPRGPERRARATLVTLPGGSSVTLPHMLYPSFSDDGRYLLGMVDEIATVWAVAETAAAGTNPRPVFAIPTTLRPSFSPGSTHLAIGYGENPERVGVFRTGTWSKARDVEVSSMALIGIGPEARHIVMGTKSGRTADVRVIDAEAGCVVAVATANDLDAVAVSRDGLRLAVTIASAVHVFALPQRCGLATHVQGAGRAVRVGFTGEDGSVAVVERAGQGGTDAAVLRTVTVDGRQTASRALPASGAAALSSDGRWLAVAEGGRLKLLDVQTAAERASADAGSSIETLSVSADPLRVAAVTAESKLHVWDGLAMRAIGSVALPDEVVREFLAVGSRAVAAMTAEVTRSGLSQTVRRWTVPSLEAVSELHVGTHRGGLAASTCGLSADGSRVLIRALGIGVIVRDTQTGADIAVVDDTGKGEICALSEDGRYLAVESAADVRIWDAAGAVEVARVWVPGGVQQIAFSPGAGYLALLSDAGAVSIASLRAVDLVEQACARLPSNISADDWERYVGREPVRAACPNLPAGER